MRKRIWALFLAMTMVWYTLAGSVAAAESEGAALLAEEETEILAEEEAAPLTEEETGILASGECGENVRYVLTEDGTLTFSGTGEMEFEATTNLGYDMLGSVKTVVIENGITNVSDRAFVRCENLVRVVLAEGITSIGYFAFDFCSSLKEINIPKGVTLIDSYAFYNCDALTEINLPEGVTSIGSYTFCECNNLKEINIPTSVLEIGVDAFYGTPWAKAAMEANKGYLVVNGILTDYTGTDTELQIPENVTEINSSVFRGNENITSVTIPDQVKNIGRNTFRGCSNLAEINIPNSVTKIEYGIFANCSSLAEVEIPENVTTIEETAFRDTAMKSITIPKSVTSIEPYAMGYNLVRNNDGIYEFEEVEGFTIYGYKSTEAETYANGGETFVFVALDEGDTPVTPGETGLEIIADKTDEYYVIGSGTDAVIYCTGEFSKFVSVEMDGVIVDPANYTIVEGSTVLTFASAYLDTLSVGVHKVKLNYIDDSITTTLTILERGSSIPSGSGNTNGQTISGGGLVSTGTVQTGDASSMMLWMSVAALAIAAGSIIVINNRRKKAL